MDAHVAGGCCRENTSGSCRLFAAMPADRVRGAGGVLAASRPVNLAAERWKEPAVYRTGTGRLCQASCSPNTLATAACCRGLSARLPMAGRRFDAASSARLQAATSRRPTTAAGRSHRHRHRGRSAGGYPLLRRLWAQVARVRRHYCGRRQQSRPGERWPAAA